MSKEIKLFAEELHHKFHEGWLPNYPGHISRRLLNDLADNILYEHKSINHELISAVVEQARGLSAVLTRQMGAVADELIYLDKAPNVDTSTAELASRLKQGIEGISDYDVVIGELDPALDPPDANPLEHRIRIIHAPAQGSGEWTPNFSPHRFVYVALPDVSPEEVQTRAAGILAEGLINNGEAHYCSLIPTIITQKHDHGFVEFKTEAVYDRTDLRFNRDKTVLSASDDDPAILHTDANISTPEIERWARNVLIKQIGFASSGGGASAYRSIALLRKLEAEGVPVDVFGGLSGGSLIGAYLAAKGDAGLDKVLDRGINFAWKLPRAILSTKPLAQIIDKDLDNRRVGETSLRYFAVTTEMCKDVPPGTPPKALVITQGTMGQAVRASSALPLGFAPTTIGGHRFTDGMASSIVPTHVVIDHGGDVIISCNCMPGPDQSNPFSKYRLGRFLYDVTPLGRYIDLWTWTNFLVQNASTAFSQGSNVYFQFRPENISSLEFLDWAGSYDILDKANREHQAIAAAVSKLKGIWDALP